jgi:hypothetical protein
MIRRLFIILLFAANAFAITREERAQLGELLPYLLETHYVLPEKGKELATQLRANFAKGAYDGATTTAALVEAINRDLSAANDRHLALRYRPENESAPLLTLEAFKARTSGGPMMMRRPVDRESLRRTNFGVAAAEVLEGNVGYLKISQFQQADETRAAIDHAMAFLANTDAMIVDVRDCPGGSADAVSYLASYFFGPEKRVLMNRYNRPMNSTMDSTTVDVGGARRPDTPLYVLTNGRSASACESFAFTLQQWGRAKTVGEKTAGAGYNNIIVDLGRGLAFSISIGTATHPKTKKQFEAVGVAPDISVASDKAVDAARKDALR